MNSKDKIAWDMYDLAEQRLKAFTRSAIRTKILLNLMNGGKNVGELEKELGIRASTLLHSVKEMIDEDVVIKTSQGYMLTNIGQIQALILDGLVSTLVALDTHKDFWLTHDIRGIPASLLNDIGMLSKSEVLEGDLTSVLKTQQFFISELEKSKWIRGVSPVIIPGWAEAIAIAVKNGAEVDLILTEKVFDIVIEQNSDLLRQLMRYANFRVYRIRRNVTVAFTVTESLLSLGLFRLNGSYDIGTDLNCIGDMAIEWGNRLFEYYQGKSERMESLGDS